MIVILALMILTSLINPAMLGTEINYYFAMIIMELLVYALPAVFFCRMRGREYGKYLRLRLFPLSHIFLILLALSAMLSGCSLINYGMEILFPQEAADAVSYAGAADGGIYALLTFCILPAVAEEFLFRGILLTEYESVSVPFAVGISSLYFAMMHLNFVRFPAYLFSGVLLALVLYATRSVFASMVLHILNNIAALWTEEYAEKFQSASGSRSVLLVFILACILFVSLILFFMEAQRIYQNYGENAVPSPYVPKNKQKDRIGVLEAISVPPFVAFIVICIAFAIIAG